MSEPPPSYPGRALRSRAADITLLPLLQYERNRLQRHALPLSVPPASSADTPPSQTTDIAQSEKPVKKKELLTEAQAMGVGQRHKKSWKKPSKWVVLTQWARTNMLRKGVLLDQYRKQNYAYFEEEYNRCWKANRAPTSYRGKKDGKANMKGMVWEIIRNLFRPHSDIPYQIDHWEIDGEWKGMGLFTTCETTTGNIGRAFKEYEPDNCQLLWAPATLEYYESIYTCKWLEKKKGARKKGWYLKQNFVKEETDTHYRLEAPFFLYGILMFANHGDRAPFFFREFIPIPPSNNKGRMFGFVTIELHDDTWDYPVPAGHQILIHYDHNMTSFGQKPVLDLDEVVEEGDVEVMGMTPLTLTAAEEQMQVMEEMIEERDNADDSDYQPEIVVGVGYRIGRRFRTRARRRPDSSQSD